jgi:DNA-directed RNA polymerase I, II, and III subunit RPABC2
MSDIEDYLSGDDSDSVSSSNSEEEVITKKPIHLKKKDVDEFVSDDDDAVEEDADDGLLLEEDSEMEDEDEDEEEDLDDENIYGEEDGDQTVMVGGAATTKEKTVKKQALKKPSVPIALEDSDDEEESNDEHYLQKFDQEIKKNYVQEHHPECIIHNYEEVKALSQVVRDSNNIIIDPLHRTLPFLTKYEKARILGQRAKQIEAGAKPFVKVPENVIDGYLVASIELREKKIPFILRRPLPNGGCEYWNLRDLEQITF